MTFERETMSQTIRTADASTETNANKAALPGFNLDSPDYLRIDGIILSIAKTKKGGYNFSTGVLFTKTTAELKSLAGLSQGARLPENIASHIQKQCAKLAENATAELLQSGFNPLRQSASKVTCDFKNSRVTRRVTQTFEKLQNFENQLKDIKWTISQAQVMRLKLEEKLCESSEQQARNDESIAKLDKRLEQMTRLEKIITIERDEQLKASTEAQG